MNNGKDVESSQINFIAGDQIEVYFPEEKIEYRFSVSSKVFEGYEDCLVVNLPNEYVDTFYKGEDYIQCRYVSDNIVYKFGGEILKLVYENVASIIIKKPTNLHRGSYRTKNRVSTQILCEYFVQRVVPGEYLSRMQGFATIKDASVGGVSFLTTDTLPNNTVLKMIFNQPAINILVEVTNAQKVNEKNFYGGKLVGYEGDSEAKFKKYLEDLINQMDTNTFVGEVY